MISRDDAFKLLKKYNKESFHIQHAITVEEVMKWYANKLNYTDEAEYWGIVGLLHDIDFELYPEERRMWYVKVPAFSFSKLKFKVF